MMVNPDKKRCSVEGCKAWAKRGTDLCVSHSRAAGVWTPKQSVNATKPALRGSRTIPHAQGDALLEGSSPKHRGGGDAKATQVQGVPTIEDEIALLVARRDEVDRWLHERMDEDDHVNVVRYLSMLGQLSSRIARMVQASQALGKRRDTVAELFDAALDEIASGEGVEVEL